MSDDTFEDPYELINVAEHLPYGATRIAAYEHAIAVADAAEELWAGYVARMGHVAAATFGGASERALVSFAWCLARFDEDPGRFSDVLWSYKWIAHSLPDFAAVPDVRIQELIDDLERRFLPFHGGDVAVAKIRVLTAASQGRLDVMAHWLERWRASLAQVGYDNELADCRACDLSMEGRLLSDLGRHEEAIAVVAPILDGSSSCTTVPHSTYAWLLRTSVATGRLGEAAELHRRGYELIKDNPDYLYAIGKHADYLRWAGDVERARSLVDRHWAWFEASNTDTDRVSFAAAAARVLVAASAEERARAAQARAHEMAAALDHRNGNDYWRSVCDVDPYEGFPASAG